MHKFALIIDIPEEKPVGFYEGILQGLEQRVASFDLDKELIVLDSLEDRDVALEQLEQEHISAEELTLLLLPPDSDLYPPFSDYGFTSRRNQHYLYEHLVQAFKFSAPILPLAETSNALLQMQEHLVAHYTLNSTSYYMIDLHFRELIERIAIAYKCTVCFIEAL